MLGIHSSFNKHILSIYFVPDIVLDRTGYITCRTQCKMKIQDSLLSNFKNFKMVTAEHSFKWGVLLSLVPYSAAQVTWPKNWPWLQESSFKCFETIILPFKDIKPFTLYVCIVRSKLRGDSIHIWHLNVRLQTWTNRIPSNSPLVACTLVS